MLLPKPVRAGESERERGSEGARERGSERKRDFEHGRMGAAAQVETKGYEHGGTGAALRESGSSGGNAGVEALQSSPGEFNSAQEGCKFGAGPKKTNAVRVCVQ